MAAEKENSESSMSSRSLPVDLLLDLLTRLPVKHLLRFTCVSKSWSALIDSQEFIKIHLNRSLVDSKVQKILVVGGCSDSKLFSGDCQSPENFIATVEKVYQPHPEEMMTLLGSCNGLLCIKYSKSGVFLCNPWTRKHQKLPHKPIETELPRGRKWIYGFYGFGYDDVNDDYKVVRVVGFRDKFSMMTFSNEIKVYSLKSNSWRRIEDFPNPIFAYYSPCNGVLLNSALHWIWRFNLYDYPPAGGILAIDLRTEKRQTIPLPDFSRNGVHPNVLSGMNTLRVLNGCLRLVSPVNFFDVNVWVMKDYGVGDSWTKLVVKQSNYKLYPSPISGPYPYTEGQKQLVFRNNNELIWYDPEKDVFAMISMSAVSGYIRHLSYSVVSLVSPHAGRNRGIKRRRPNCKK